MTSPPRPSLQPTRISNLLLITLIGGVLAWWGTEFTYGDLPPLPWGPVLTVTAVAVLEAVAAWITRSRLPRRVVKDDPEGIARPPMDPLMVARLAVLAKASSVLGALIVGVFAGAVTWLWPQRERISAVSNDLPVAGWGIVAGLLLVGAALWLEYGCRIPRNDQSDPSDGVSDADMGRNA